jgi:hypothetical protein
MKRALKSVVQSASSLATVASAIFTPAYREFRFKDFCPKLFAKVRAHYKISAQEYAEAFRSTCRESFSEGRSGAFLFFSSDQKYIVKTTTRQESLTLHQIMPLYVRYLQAHPHSLLVRFLSAHCITMYGHDMYFIVMMNVFPNVPLSERYDLKGSWVNRYGVKGKQASSKTKRRKRYGNNVNRLSNSSSRRRRTERGDIDEEEGVPLYQDNDVQHAISLDVNIVNSLAEQIRKDITFLKDLNFMDYSLLIGVRRERFKILHSTGNEDNSNNGDGDNMVSRPSVISLNNLSANNLVASGTPAVSDDANGSGASSAVSKSRASSLYGYGPFRATSKAVSLDNFQREEDGGMRAQIVEGPGTFLEIVSSLNSFLL